MSSGGQRRSMRIIELEAKKVQEAVNKKKRDGSLGSAEGQTSQRQRKKKSTVNHAWSNRAEKAVAVSADTPLPQMSAMQLLLNLLKRRDAFKIFAEPVNAAKVIGYGNVVKNPMDFATISTKLSEGKYKVLEDFENDVFLVFSNAMFFNPSDTIYYRQARVIREVATKLFIALRADASNFENEFALASLHSDGWTKAEARLLNSKASNQWKKLTTAGKVEVKVEDLLQQQKMYSPWTFYPSEVVTPAPAIFGALDSQKTRGQINHSSLSYGQNVNQMSNFIGGCAPAAQIVAQPRYDGALGLWHAPSCDQLPVSYHQPAPGTAFHGGGLHPSVYLEAFGGHGSVSNQIANAPSYCPYSGNPSTSRGGANAPSYSPYSGNPSTSHGGANAPSYSPYSGNPSTSHGGNRSIFDAMSLDDFLKYLLSF